ncbi:MAG: DNA/RNA non-specific endonuclease [Saprospiraceae bacterium]|nr:DNA/RNA non-specific endonuclease [Saprospiraceae bacterium]
MKINDSDFIEKSINRNINIKTVPIPQSRALFSDLKIQPHKAIIRYDHLINNKFEPFDSAKERIIGNNDLMPINYLLFGYITSISVCRIHVRNENGGNLGYGTGFLISPSLLITNNHVFKNELFAKNSLAEFNFQYDLNGVPEKTFLFEFEPEILFKTNETLDYSIVAIKKKSVDSEKTLSEFNFLKLYEETGKALVSENLSIIQHPGGGYKQVAVRENVLLPNGDRPSDFILYSTDTTQGSSGAAVFNDQWQVVALHSSGVPKRDKDGNWLSLDGTIWKKGMDDSQVDWVSNEGIRISSIIKDFKSTHGTSNLFKEMIEIPVKNKIVPLKEIIPSEESTPIISNSKSKPKNINVMEQNSLTVTIPIEVTVKIGSGYLPNPDKNIFSGMTDTKPTDEAAFEIAKSIDSDYIGRKGYNSNFLAKSGFKIELSDILVSQLNKLAPLLNPNDKNKYFLNYHNFTIAINKHRKLCTITAVNIDGKQMKGINRENTPWILDPRMDEEYQTGPKVYASNDLDRGHMVRRFDPVWGPNANAANDDTFHFSNSTPQHKNLNQKTWLSLEDYILRNTDKENLKVSVFTGPVFGDDDIPYRGTLLPLQFWKVAAMIKKDGNPSVTGYILKQPDEISDFKTEELIADDGFGRFKTYQVPISRIARLTGIKFEKFNEFDPLFDIQATEGMTLIEIISPDDIKI